jgi:hypothetical protein
MNQKSIKIDNQTAAQTIPFVVLQDSWVQLSYGWVMALESRDDGFYGQIKWSKAGNELLENAQSLISVGLTNQPNIPVPSIPPPPAKKSSNTSPPPRPLRPSCPPRPLHSSLPSPRSLSSLKTLGRTGNMISMEINPNPAGRVPPPGALPSRGDTKTQTGHDFPTTKNTIYPNESSDSWKKTQKI